MGADSLVSRLNTGQRIQIGDFDMRQHLALREHAVVELFSVARLGLPGSRCGTTW